MASTVGRCMTSMLLPDLSVFVCVSELEECGRGVNGYFE